MMSSDLDARDYENLTCGLGRGLITTHRLWLGKDHLLNIRRPIWSESYKRFYFRDIQAIVLSATQTGRVLNAMYGLFAVIGCGLLLLLEPTAANTGLAPIVFIGFGLALAVTALVVNIMLGPTCRCVLYTDVQTEPLRALGRFRTARVALQRIQALVEQTQGTLPDDRAFGQPYTPAAQPSASRPELLRHDEGRLHGLLFLLMLIGAVSSALDFSIRNQVKDLFDTLWLLGTVILAIVILVKHANTDVQARLGKLVWTTLVAQVVFFFFESTSYTVTTMIRNARNPESAFSLNHVQPMFLHQSYFYALNIVICAIYTALGVTGLRQLSLFRRMYRHTAERDPAAPISDPASPEQT